jgi:hypothetical protein
MKLKNLNKDESISQGNYRQMNLNNSQGYIKPFFNDKEERKIEEYSKNLTAKEKKIVEQNPKLDIIDLKKIKSNNVPAERNSNYGSMDFSTHNNTLFNRINFNNSNIFNDTVIF